MSRTKRNHWTSSLRRTRAWAAPRVERSGQVLQDTIAPRVSAALSSAAHRLEPAPPRRGRWRKLADVSMLTAAASAVAAFIRNRRQRDDAASAGEPDTHEMMPAEGTSDLRASTSANADTDGQVRTSGTASR